MVRPLGRGPIAGVSHRQRPPLSTMHRSASVLGRPQAYAAAWNLFRCLCDGIALAPAGMIATALRPFLSLSSTCDLFRHDVYPRYLTRIILLRGIQTQTPCTRQ
jgi:hypothetical protein